MAGGGRAREEATFILLLKITIKRIQTQLVLGNRFDDPLADWETVKGSYLSRNYKQVVVPPPWGRLITLPASRRVSFRRKATPPPPLPQQQRWPDDSSSYRKSLLSYLNSASPSLSPPPLLLLLLRCVIATSKRQKTRAETKAARPAAAAAETTIIIIISGCCWQSNAKTHVAKKRAKHV